MYEDVIGKNSPKVVSVISCRKCGSIHVDSVGKTAMGIVLTNNNIYNRYKVFIECYECGATYYISQVR